MHGDRQGLREHKPLLRRDSSQQVQHQPRHLEGRSYVIEGHGVCLIPASTEGTVARPKYEIGSTVLVRLVADICRCKVSYRYHCGEVYIYRVERVANHGGIRRTVAIEIYEIDIIEQLKEAEEWNNKPYESMTTMSSEKMDDARDSRQKLEEQRRHARWYDGT